MESNQTKKNQKNIVTVRRLLWQQKMCPKVKKNETSRGKKKANGTVNVTFTNDGKIFNDDDGWGED
eukprot:10030959-Ditylum_brightwellii.AAC.1